MDSKYCINNDRKIEVNYQSIRSWGRVGLTFICLKWQKLIPIDFDDVLTKEIDEVRNSHLYRRIWMRTDSFVKALSRYVDIYNINHDGLTQMEYRCSSRCFSLNGTIVLFIDSILDVKYPKNEITETVEKRIHR